MIPLHVIISPAVEPGIGRVLEPIEPVLHVVVWRLVDVTHIRIPAKGAFITSLLRARMERVVMPLALTAGDGAKVGESRPSGVRVIFTRAATAVIQDNIR